MKSSLRSFFAVAGAFVILSTCACINPRRLSLCGYLIRPAARRAPRRWRVHDTDGGAGDDSGASAVLFAYGGHQPGGAH